MHADKIFVTVNGRKRLLSWLTENASAATDVRIENCPAMVTPPDLPAATDVWIENCPAMVTPPDLPAATLVWIINCPAMVTPPDLPAATVVRIENCPAMVTVIDAGEDSRGYRFIGIPIRGEYRIVAGCRNFTLSDARKHWGPKGPSNRPDCLALVEKIAAQVTK